MARGKRVYIPEVDMVFESVAAAARYLGVNSANLSQVVRGKRKTAGGYNAIDASIRVSKSGKVTKPNRASLRNKAAKKGITVKDPLYQERMQLKSLLEDANKKRAEIIDQGLSYFARKNHDAMAFLQDIGGKGGFYKTDYASLRELSAAEIKKYSDAISKAAKYDTYTAAGALRHANVRANALGTTATVLSHYERILPFFFDIIDRLDGSKSDTDKTIEKAVDLMNSGADEEVVIQALIENQQTYDNIEALTNLIYQDDSIINDLFDNEIMQGLKNLLHNYEIDPGNDRLRKDAEDVTSYIINNLDYFRDYQTGDLMDGLRDYLYNYTEE